MCVCLCNLHLLPLCIHEKKVNIFPPSLLQELREAAGEEEAEVAERMAEALLSEDLPDAVFGAAKAGPGMWASLVRVIEPIQGKTLHTIHLDQNEAAFRWV